MCPSQYRVLCRRDLKGSNGRNFRDFLTVDGTTSDVEIRECGIGGGQAPYIQSVCCTMSDKSEGAELEEMTLTG